MFIGGQCSSAELNTILVFNTGTFLSVNNNTGKRSLFISLHAMLCYSVKYFLRCDYIIIIIITCSVLHCKA